MRPHTHFYFHSLSVPPSHAFFSCCFSCVISSLFIALASTLSPSLLSPTFAFLFMLCPCSFFFTRSPSVVFASVSFHLIAAFMPGLYSCSCTTPPPPTRHRHHSSSSTYVITLLFLKATPPRADRTAFDLTKKNCCPQCPRGTLHIQYPLI